MKVTRTHKRKETGNNTALLTTVVRGVLRRAALKREDMTFERGMFSTYQLRDWYKKRHTAKRIWHWPIGSRVIRYECEIEALQYQDYNRVSDTLIKCEEYWSEMKESAEFLVHNPEHPEVVAFMEFIDEA